MDVSTARGRAAGQYYGAGAKIGQARPASRLDASGGSPTKQVTSPVQSSSSMNKTGPAAKHS